MASNALNNKLNQIQKDKKSAIESKEKQNALDKAKKLKKQKQQRTAKNIVEYNATQANTHLISGFLRKLDIEESDDIKKQRYQFRQFVKVLKGVNYFKGTKDGSDAYYKKLESKVSRSAH